MRVSGLAAGVLLAWAALAHAEIAIEAEARYEIAGTYLRVTVITQEPVVSLTLTAGEDRKPLDLLRLGQVLHAGTGRPTWLYMAGTHLAPLLTISASNGSSARSAPWTCQTWPAQCWARTP